MEACMTTLYLAYVHEREMKNEIEYYFTVNCTWDTILYVRTTVRSRGARPCRENILDVHVRLLPALANADEQHISPVPVRSSATNSYRHPIYDTHSLHL
jgi:hypothetical protein